VSYDVADHGVLDAVVLGRLGAVCGVAKPIEDADNESK
jgi:hypothetical protein